MKFFRYFPKTVYQFQADANTTFKVNITNPTIHFIIRSRLQQHIQVIYDYMIVDGERPDTVATKLYGSPDFTWLVLVTNNFMSLYDWPLTESEFNDYIVERYGTVANAQGTFIYKTASGYQVDETTYNLLDADEQGDVVDNYTVELDRNELKRRIKVIPAEFAEVMVSELRKALV